MDNRARPSHLRRIDTDWAPCTLPVRALQDRPPARDDAAKPSDVGDSARRSEWAGSREPELWERIRTTVRSSFPVAVLNAKGGVGTTTVVEALGSTLAKV